MDIAIGLCTTPEGDRVAAITDERVYMLDTLVRAQAADSGARSAAPSDRPTTLIEFLEEGKPGISRAKAAVEWAEKAGLDAGPAEDPLFWPLAEGQQRAADGAPVRLKAPISPTNKIMCFGDIFLSHLAVRGTTPPDRVGIFYKLTADVVGPWEPIILPRVHKDGVMVGGTEMALVVGKTGRYIPSEQVWAHIWGFSVFNDVTLRGLHPQLGNTPKEFETSAPIGPYLVPRARIANPNALALRMRINGEQVQLGNTADMRFSLSEAIAELSKWHQLRPGDIIATGDIGSTDGLHPGDVVEAEVEGIATLANPITID